ncbi:MAG: UDP-N-acetylmuramoyl-L-alanyl-D-glutamate--2,6-diaminopimelate ligase [Planctomycetota bacterium]|nr:UDP-N-acetylmuramoyl-L-alanyl-D-glutamate--2,6-diaminopimelate ligase [Planctomycetota bacterium]
MFLHQLFAEFDPAKSLTDIPKIEIRGIADDSRLVQPGDLFIARSGQGLKYVADAQARGAVALVASARVSGCSLPQVVVSDPAAAAGLLAHIFFHHPAQKLRVVGVTGTNGKTTTAYLIRHVLRKFNIRCGMIGTVEVDDGRAVHPSELTTPGAVELAGLLARMRGRGCRACAMEVSSHALQQSRAAGIHFAGAAFTNLTGDHLDYHGTMEKYAAAKAMLFKGLGDDAVAIVNAEDKWSATMTAGCKGRIIRFGFGKNADYRARDIAVTAEGSHFILHTPDGQAEVEVGLIGKHNIANALTAAAIVGEVFGLSVHQIASGLKDAPGAPGRLQAVRAGQPFAVLVDYAHTDDALENVLTAMRPLTRGKLRVLFGCGGDRDRTKRPRMARTAARLADAVYVTSDNPRKENPAQILDDIFTGFGRNHSTPIVREPDRRAAIEKILTDADAGDVVILAGKGHEDYQIINDVKFHFDDVEEATRVLMTAGVNRS